jgi:hypothetical protein
VWDFLTAQAARKVYVASGKKILQFNLADAKAGELMPLITGRTGNLRAPAILLGDSWYIGYNEEMYQGLAGG